MNLGDEAIIAAVVKNIRSRKPDTTIVGFSINPEDTQKRHKIKSYPIRKRKNETTQNIHTNHRQRLKQHAISTKKNITFLNRFKDSAYIHIEKFVLLKAILKIPFHIVNLFKSVSKEIIFIYDSFKILKAVDKLFISGSNQFLDNFGGVFGFPYTLLKWTVLARIAGVKVYFISLGAGPIKNGLSMMMIKVCIALCDYISFRDVGSKNLVGQWNNPNAKVFPDLAFSQNYLKLNQNDRISKKAIRTIGINPMPVFDKRYWPISSDEKYHRYIKSIAKLYIHLKLDEFEPFFYNTQKSDLLVIKDIIALIQDQTNESGTNSQIRVQQSNELEELMETIGTADILIPTRYHGIILAYMTEKPVVGLCYGPKSKEVITNVTRMEYAFDIENFQPRQMICQVKRIAEDYDNTIEQIRSVKKLYGRQLELQYEFIVD